MILEELNILAKDRYNSDEASLEAYEQTCLVGVARGYEYKVVTESHLQEVVCT